jgi:hypothetical protein
MPGEKFQEDLAAYAEIEGFAPLPVLTFSKPGV